MKARSARPEHDTGDQRVYARYTVEYYHEGDFWYLDIFATSFADADARVKQLQYAIVLGRAGPPVSQVQ